MDVKAQFESLSPAHLDVLLLKNHDIDASSLLRNGSPEDISRVPTRRNLFFGIVPKYLPMPPAH